MPIYEWPSDWYRSTQSTFRIQARSQTTPRSYIGGKSVYGPHAAIWMTQLTLAPQAQDSLGQAMAAFFSRLDGQAGLIRIGDPLRLMPQANRVAKPSINTWDDDTLFDDGTGWENRPVPPYAVVAVSASRGENYLVIKALAASKSRLLRRGDLLELRPNGIATETPNLYEIQVDGSTNSSGEVGIEIRPRLRQGFAVGDMVVFDRPTSVFRLVDDDQGAAEMSLPRIANIGFSLVEAIV